MEKLKQLIKFFEWEMIIKTIAIVLIIEDFWKWFEWPIEGRVTMVLAIPIFSIFYFSKQYQELKIRICILQQNAESRDIPNYEEALKWYEEQKEAQKKLK